MTIEEICNKYKIVNYTINTDGTIDVNGSVNLSHNNLTKLPLKFNRVSSYFDCSSNNKLTSLEGSPKSVGGGFSCGYNKLTDLKGSPVSVGGTFNCAGNQLTSLEGCPKEVGGNFNCNNNQLTDLKGFNTNFKGEFYCHTNPIGSILGSIFVFDEVDQDFTVWFNQLKIIKGDQVVLNRLKYLQTIFDFDIDLEEIKKNYTIV